MSPSYQKSMTDAAVKGEPVGSEQIFDKEVEYTFAIRKKKLICTEYLYVSDHLHESHYRHSHPKNNGEPIQISIPVLKPELIQ